MRLAVAIVLLLASYVAHGATYNAASSSYADVNAKTSIAVDGDTVIVPAGTSTWGSTLYLDAAITLQGDGTNTLSITSSTVCVYLRAGARVTGFHFTTSGAQAIWIESPRSTEFRIDNCRIDAATGGSSMIFVRGQTSLGGQPLGVIDHNTLYNTKVMVYGHAGLYNWQGWAEPSAIGTRNNVFVENNTFLKDRTGDWIDHNYGSTMTVRFNNFIGSGTVDMHGCQGNTTRGAKSLEFYGNVLTNVGLSVHYPMLLRGGTHIAVSNVWTGTWSYTKIALDNHRNLFLLGFGEDSLRDENTVLYSGTHTGANGAATLTDAAATFGNLTTGRTVPTGGNPAYYLVNTTSSTRGRITAYTGNTATATGVTWNTGDTYEVTGGYRPRDGIGAGPDTYLGSKTDYPLQSDEPSYFWSNTNNAALMDVGVVNGCSWFIVEGRDYNLTAKPGWTPFTYPHPLVSGAPPEATTLALSAATYSVGELDGTITITATRSGSTVGAVSVDLFTDDDTAQAGRDYSATSSTLTWADGVGGNKTDTVTILHNGIVLGDLTFKVGLTGPVDATLASPSLATVTITEGDTPAPPAAVGFDDASLSFLDTVLSKNVTVYRYDNFSGTCSVAYTTVDGTALAGTDYTLTAGTLSFADSQTSGTITIPITKRDGYQGNRTFRLVLSTPTDCTLIAATTMELEIQDSISPPKSVWRNALILNASP